MQKCRQKPQPDRPVAGYLTVNSASPFLPHCKPASTPVATQGGMAHTPRKATTLGWRSAAIMLASLQRQEHKNRWVRH